MIRLIHIAFLFFMMLNFTSLAQGNLDSLKRELKNPNLVGKERVGVLIEIVDIASLTKEERSLYLNEAKIIAEKLDDDILLFEAYDRMTHNYGGRYMQDSALVCAEKTLELARKIKDRSYLMEAYRNKAFVLVSRRGDDMEERRDEGIELFWKSYRIAEDLRDTINMIEIKGRIMFNYFRKKDLKTMWQLYNEIRVLRQNMDPLDVPGVYYDNTARIFESLQMYDSAIYYGKMWREQTRIEKWEVYGGASAALSRLAWYHIGKKDYGAAKAYLDSALEAVKWEGQKIEIYHKYYSLYKVQDKFEEALYYHEMYTAAFSEERDKGSTSRENIIRRYQKDFEENARLQALEKERIEKEEESRMQSRNLIIALSSAGGLLLIGFFLFILFTRKRKALEESERLQLELAAQKERAERSEAFKQQFLANMSHEIRTPMNAVLGMTNLVLNTELTDKQRNYLEKVKISSDNLLHIINDILDLSKVESGKMELEQIDFSLKETLELVKHTLEMKADEKGLALFTQMDTDVEDVVIGDPIRLNQVLLNLTNNALKFTEHGSVLIKLSKTESKIRFEVTDTGIGIPNDKIEQVFESFQQANASDTRQYGGTGLGLTISQELIHLMGGEISIESEVGKGTTFSFELELEKGDATRYEQGKNTSLVLDGNVLNGLTILLADDNEYNRIVARDTLEGLANVTIIEAENGQEVLDKLNKKVDVILMDVQMPVMSGFEATDKIRKGEFKEVPIIVLTASVLRSDLDKCKEAGMNGYVPKPFRTFELIKSIAEALKLEVKETEVNTPKSKEQVIDLDHLYDFCDGDEKKIEKYKKLFREGAEEFTAELDKQLQIEDAIAIADLVHKFNTRLSLMGMKTAKELSIRVEDRLRKDTDIQEIRSDLDRLKELIAKGVTELKKV